MCSCQKNCLCKEKCGCPASCNCKNCACRSCGATNNEEKGKKSVHESGHEQSKYRHKCGDMGCRVKN